MSMRLACPRGHRSWRHVPEEPASECIHCYICGEVWGTLRHLETGEAVDPSEVLA